MNRLPLITRVLLAVACLIVIVRNHTANAAPPFKPSGRIIVAEVVALDQPFMLNRLGSFLNTPRIFALRKDVETDDGKPLPDYKDNPDLIGFAGNVRLKGYKRPRPIVLRANVGDILEIRFTNLLNPQPSPFAGLHVMGLSLANSIDDDSSWVGANDLVSTPQQPAGSFAANAGQKPTTTGGPSRVYRYLADAEGVFILYSATDPINLTEGGNGLFGSVIVEPPQAEYYRSQVLRTDMVDATYSSRDLPANMVLRREPRRPGEPEELERWLLTTYRTRLHDFVVKNVYVKIRPEEPFNTLKPILAAGRLQPKYLLRNLRTGELEKEQRIPTDPVKLRAAQEQGSVIPDGKLYASEGSDDSQLGHPLIEYGCTYAADHARPAGWPVLAMVYPQAVSVLSALKDTIPGKSADPTVYKLPQSQQSKYSSAVNQLDTGVVPRELWPILNAWGITEMSNVTRVAPQLDYFDGDLNPGQRVSRKGSENYIWLLTGVRLNNQDNSSVIIHGNAEQLTLRFIQVELQTFHSDLTAIITGPNAEGFGDDQQSPSAYLVPASPYRAEPFREFALGYHNGGGVTQAFPEQNGKKGPLVSVLGNGGDKFGINYGMAGIGTEILANRLGVGPEGFNGDGADLKFEEFFLSSWAAGDPAMLVDRPANSKTPGRATKVFYPDDPSNVYHSYMRDHVKMRVYNAGENAPHVHHLHAHQWLRSPNSDESSYLDSQLIVPGSAFTLEIAYNGSGNRNQTVGDSIFHCHFYPHFAQGMWSLWRVHDVFEDGTPLDAKGKVVDGSNDPEKWIRALPDAEIATGTPIPAIIPLPTLAMAPIPPPVRVTRIPDLPAEPAGGTASSPDLKKWVRISDKDGKNPSMGRMAQVKPSSFATDGTPQFSNPGFPFFIPGVAGHRPPHPPLAMGWKEKDGVPDLNEYGEKQYLDGGLPRHQVLGGQIVREFHTAWDFTKDYIRYDANGSAVDGALVAYRIPEDGTPIEKAAMRAHATRTVPTVQPDGRQGSFVHNGLKPVSGAPFADPGVDDQGNAVRSLRKYKAAVIQKDVVFNKAGWHYPQERFLTLWQDVKPTFDEKRPVQPFFFRANSGETVEYWHTNLVPEYYELDDFQVRTPTDIIGQHIHLVKFDVTASDGAENGFNYESGTISPDDVRSRIYAITRPFAKPGASYSLFELAQPKGHGANDYVAGVDWKNFVAKKPEPTPWSGSYLQKEMSQGEVGKANPLNPPPGQNWDGAMTTIMRFSTDPLLDNKGIDRTVRTVFTHDHFGPSTHQQAGLYAGLLVEPEKSVWRDPVTGGLYYDPVNRTDGGPTGFEAIIEPPKLSESYREFAVEFQDLQLAYQKDGAQALKPITDLGSGAIAQPIKVPITSIPAAGTKVNSITVTDPFSGAQETLTEFFRLSGISLTDAAVFSATPQGGIVDNGENSLYQYKPGAAAFSVDAASFNLNFLHLETWSSPKQAVASPGKTTLNPQIISGGGGTTGLGTFSANYRNEPLSVSTQGTTVGRVTGSGPANNMALAYASIDRPAPWDSSKPDAKVPSLFARPKNPAEVNGEWYDPVGFATIETKDGKKVVVGTADGKVAPWDPYTPLLRGYQGDKVQVRTLVGAHTNSHSFSINGVKWLGEMRSDNSGYRNAQEMGISEHFEFEFDLPPATTQKDDPTIGAFTDYLYAPSSGAAGQSNGSWGLIRSFDGNPRTPAASAAITMEVPDTSPVESLRRLPAAANPRPYSGHTNIFPAPEPDVVFTIVAQDASILYNNQGSKLQNTQGIVYTVASIQEKGNPTPLAVTTKPGDPLILRVKAGQWAKVILQNAIKLGSPGASKTVGLHSELLAYDVNSSDGMNAGFNKIQTLNAGVPGSEVSYLWYAGDLEMDEAGHLKKPHPRELGATNLCPAAPLNQDGNGLLGALIVEPADSHWVDKDYVSDHAEILGPDNHRLFRDFVVIEQTNVAYANSNALASSAVNNKSEDLGFRQSLASVTPPVWQSYSNSLPGTNNMPIGDPQTPVFLADAGEPIRFRVLQPGGDSMGQPIMFELHGHSWQQEPWTNKSSKLGYNPKSNVLGADILVPHKALNILIDHAGGPNGVTGDYLYYSFTAGDGAWGILRVNPAPTK
jgi:hypothetical protein